MTTMSKCFLALIALCAMAESVHAQQPPDVVASDAYDNTAMGTSALSNLTPSYPNACNCYLGYSNTASGNFALNANTTGSYNTAAAIHAAGASLGAVYGGAAEMLPAVPSVLS